MRDGCLTNPKTGWVTLYACFGAMQRAEWCFSVVPYFGMHMVSKVTSSVVQQEFLKMIMYSLYPPNISLPQCEMCPCWMLLCWQKANCLASCKLVFAHRQVTLMRLQSVCARHGQHQGCDISVPPKLASLVDAGVWTSFVTEKSCLNKLNSVQKPADNEIKLFPSVAFCSGLPKPFPLTDQLKLLHLWSV